MKTKRHWLHDSPVTHETCVGCGGKGCSMCRYTGVAIYVDGPMLVKQTLFVIACFFILGFAALMLVP